MNPTSLHNVAARIASRVSRGQPKRGRRCRRQRSAAQPVSRLTQRRQFDVAHPDVVGHLAAQRMHHEKQPRPPRDPPRPLRLAGSAPSASSRRANPASASAVSQVEQSEVARVERRGREARHRVGQPVGESRSGRASPSSHHSPWSTQSLATIEVPIVPVKGRVRGTVRGPASPASRIVGPTDPSQVRAVRGSAGPAGASDLGRPSVPRRVALATATPAGRVPVPAPGFRCRLGWRQRPLPCPLPCEREPPGKLGSRLGGRTPAPLPGRCTPRLAA